MVLEFDEYEYGKTDSSRTKTPPPATILFLMKYGLIKSERQATAILVVIIFLFIIASFVYPRLAAPAKVHFSPEIIQQLPERDRPAFTNQ